LWPNAILLVELCSIVLDDPSPTVVVTPGKCNLKAKFERSDEAITKDEPKNFYG